MTAESPELIKTVTAGYADLIWVCQALCELLETENEALRRHDAAKVRDLTENKTTLGRLYAKTLVAVMGPDSPVKDNLGRDDLIRLHDLGKHLSELMDQNALMLKVGIEARKRVMEVFVNASKEQYKNTINYSKKGHFDALAVSREHAALAFNKTL